MPMRAASPARQGLAGLSKSRALFSFQRSGFAVAVETATRRPPLAMREADGELSLDCCCCQQGCVARRALFLQHGQYRTGRHACQPRQGGDRPDLRSALRRNDLSAVLPPDLRALNVRGMTRIAPPPAGSRRQNAPPATASKRSIRVRQRLSSSFRPLQMRPELKSVGHPLAPGVGGRLQAPQKLRKPRRARQAP